MTSRLIRRRARPAAVRRALAHWSDFVFRRTQNEQRRGMPSADKVGRKTPSSGSGGAVRSQSAIKRVNMYRTRAKRDSKGNVVHEAFHNSTAPLDGRIAPNRQWFGNTRVVGQADLKKMQDLVETESRDPNTFLVRSKRLPTALIRPLPEQATVKLQEVEPFDKTFGPKAQRKRSKLPTTDLDELMRSSAAELSTYSAGADTDTAAQRELRQLSYKTEYDPKLVRGQTNRIYSEIFKVIDSSDVIIYVLDARDPDGTRSRYLEKYLRFPENEHKHMVFVLNKCDLVPTWVTAAWIKVLSKAYPTIAFHASLEHPFGKGELMSVLRQFAQLHRDKQQISVGLCGYPNVGKSSIINALLGSNSCRTAPVPGETKIWQYVTLTKRIFLIDAPGVVWAGTNQLKAPTLKEEMGPEAAAWAEMIEAREKAGGREAPQKSNGDGGDGGGGGEAGVRESADGDPVFLDNVTTAADLDQYHYENVVDIALVLRGVLRPEYLEHPEKYIPAIIQRVRAEHLNRTYGLRPSLHPAERWTTADELLKAVALKQGRLLRAGEPDVRTIARKLIEDFVRGKLPHFIAPYTPQDIEDYKRTIAAERVHWQGKTDAELISFENTQNLRGLGRNFAGDAQEDTFRNAFVDADGEKQRAREEQKAAEAERLRNRKPKMTSIGELYEGGASDDDSRSEEVTAGESGEESDESDGKSGEERVGGSDDESGEFSGEEQGDAQDERPAEESSSGPEQAGPASTKSARRAGGLEASKRPASSAAQEQLGPSDSPGSPDSPDSSDSPDSEDPDWDSLFADPANLPKPRKRSRPGFGADSYNPLDAVAEKTTREPSKHAESVLPTHHKSKKVVRASSTELPADFVVAKERKKRAQQVDGIKRATKLLKTRDRELKRAFLSGVVDQGEIAMITHTAGKRKKAKRDRGGASHGKTGDYFYAEAKARKGAIEKKIGKKL